MRILIKPVIIFTLLFITFTAIAQTPKPPSPAKVDREVRSAQREANDVVETVNAVNDAVNAIKDVRKTIDSIVANDRSSTPGEVHLIFVGGNNYNEEDMGKVENELKTMKDISELKRVQKPATVTLQMKTSSVPINIFKDLPRALQKLYFVHDKDAYNVVLLFKAQPRKN